MSYGVKALRKIQWGFETAAGTATAATDIYRGVGVLKDDTEIAVPEEDIGMYVSGTRTYVPRVGATLEMDEVPATFEQLPVLLSCCIEGLQTGAANGAGAGYIYQYDAPSDTANTILTMTLEMGDNQRVDEMEYAYVEELTLSGAKGEAVMMGATWKGRQATDSDFTTGLTVPTVEEILFQKGKLYINDSGDTIGTTQATNTWLGFSLTVPSGRKALFSGDGSTAFSTLVFVGHKDNAITGEITLENDAVAEAEITAARARSVRLIRMQFQGSAFQTAGTYTYKTFQVDLAVQYTEVPEVADEDGDDIVTLPFRQVYSDSTAGQFIVANGLQTLAL